MPPPIDVQQCAAHTPHVTHR